VYDTKPAIDGKLLCKELNAKPGPWMSGALSMVMERQLGFPSRSDQSTLVEQIRLNSEELKISFNK
jgi:hypothetical protein